MVGEPAILLVTDAVHLPGAAVLWALQAFAEKSDDGKGLALVTQVTQLDGSKLKQYLSSVDVLISLATNSGFHTLDWLLELARIVKPGGFLVLQEPSEQNQESLRRHILLAGFVISGEKLDPVEGIAAASGNPVMIKAQKPSWEVGSSFSLKPKTSVVFKEKANGVGSSWKLPTLDMNEDDLIDEDELLTEEDMKRPELPTASDDCEVGSGKKACKNCTCGRAEEEANGNGNGKITADLLSNPLSACGSCGLGDAFRCGTCPYKGLPPFKLGEKISLSGSLLVADV